MKRAFLLATLLSTSMVGAAGLDAVFTTVYETGEWGKPWYSGDGSTVANTQGYVAFLQQFLKDHQINSVADVGCGDWQFSRHMDWSGISYRGYDVTPGIVERNRQFESPTIQFAHLDLTEKRVPAADLLICKDVLQHLSNDKIQQFLTQLGQFRYCLITNDIQSSGPSVPNRDIRSGGYRPIVLTLPPYNLHAKEVFRFTAGATVKQVLLVENPAVAAGVRLAP
jgi:SAM-dependent methyltransferase